MSCVNHTTSFDVEANEMYFTFIEKRATIAYFLHRHEIAPPVNKNMYMDVDLQEF
jgi:hypothetical protein